MEDISSTASENGHKKRNGFYNLLRSLCKCFFKKPSPKPDILECFEVWKCHEERKTQTKQEMQDFSKKYNEAYPHSLVQLRKKVELEESEDAKNLRLRREKWKKQQIQHRQMYMAQKMEYQRKLLFLWMRKCQAHKYKIPRRSNSENNLNAAHICRQKLW
ncbi:uncharacterized protein LOC143195184 isoform X2 [Rhynchophorus ferrugineus]|uniref:uncharacterized protein LOC143195184 isoform X2 n=1 Tax=Rhynchophorus ferrugineus TaxID=354439 RepID=UPI003FCED7DF